MKVWFSFEAEESERQTQNAHSSVRRKAQPFQAHHTSQERVSATNRKAVSTTAEQRENRSICQGGYASISPARYLPGEPAGGRFGGPARRPFGGLARGVFREEFGSQNRISNRFWPKNRSYSKQRIRPSLTGSRFARLDFRHLTRFAAQTRAKNSGQNCRGVRYRRLESNPSTCLTKCKSR